MSDFARLLSEQFLEMRWRCLSLAADMDRLERSQGGEGIQTDPQVRMLREALAIVCSSEPHRAERVQTLFSDQSRGIAK